MPKRCHFVLLEGTVGSGKSTTGEKLAARFAGAGADARYWFGFDPEHPIDTRVHDVARGWSATGSIEIPANDPSDERVYTAPQWARLAARAREEEATLVLEGKYFQQCLEYLYLLGAGNAAIFAEQDRIVDAITPASPALVYFAHTDRRAHRELTVAQRPESWVPWLGGILAAHPWGIARGLSPGLATFHAFYDEWAAIERELFERHRGAKLEVIDAYVDRDRAARELEALFDVPSGGPVRLARDRV